MGWGVVGQETGGHRTLRPRLTLTAACRGAPTLFVPPVSPASHCAHTQPQRTHTQPPPPPRTHALIAICLPAPPEWQMPQKAACRRTSCGCSARRSKRTGVSLPAGSGRKRMAAGRGDGFWLPAVPAAPACVEGYAPRAREPLPGSAPRGPAPEGSCAAKPRQSPLPAAWAWVQPRRRLTASLSKGSSPAQELKGGGSGAVDREYRGELS